VYFDIAFTSLRRLFYIITQRNKQYLTQGNFYYYTKKVGFFLPAEKAPHFCDTFLGSFILFRKSFL